MATAYVDTSALIAVVFDEPSGIDIRRRLDGFDSLVSSNLLEAEVRSTFVRENLAFDPSVFFGIEWLYADEPLTAQFTIALAVGYLRGADLWHVAVALYAYPRTDEVTFVTLDRQQ